MNSPNTKDWYLINMSTGKPIDKSKIQNILDSADDAGSIEIPGLNIGISGKITGDTLTYGDNVINGLRNKVICVRSIENIVSFTTANLREYVAEKETMKSPR